LNLGEKTAVVRFWKSSFAGVPDHVRIELIDMLFQTRVPLSIAGITLAIVSSYVAYGDANPWFYVLAAAGAAVTIFRVASEIAYHRSKGHRGFTIAQAERWERLYAWSSFVFAGLIGLLGALTFWAVNSAHQLLATALVFGYAAGIVCRISVRPAIALPALMLVALPTALSALARLDGNLAFYAAILIAFLLGSFETVRFTYRQNVEQISLRHEFSSLARHDALTGLANRLGLQERLAIVTARARATGDLIAVHSVDLDRFKAVNDRYGHPVGDALLQAVAGRLSGILRDGDFAVRMGGDEFVVVQSVVDNREAAMLLGRRIIRTLSEPFFIDGLRLAVGASVGIAIGQDGDEPCDLMPAADRALYASKAGGRSRATFAKPVAIGAMAKAG
jgi:diguanylate cyclase (GGDEF)-like protein